MKKKTNISGGAVLAMVVIMGIIFGGIAVATNSSSKSSSSTSSLPAYTTYKPTASNYTTPDFSSLLKEVEEVVTWSCYDDTTFNKDPYDDNVCTSSDGQYRRVSDSQARALDPSYSPGQSGHPWYNSK